MNEVIPVEAVIGRILLIRNQKVMLDADLAKLYSVTTKRLNEQVKRNIKRFPSDFMFQLTKGESASLRSQIATLKRGQHSKYLPYAFTELGVAMLSTVLNSDRAIEINIIIMRAFVKLREIISTNKKVEEKLNEIEARLDNHDEKIFDIMESIDKMINSPERPIKKIGFQVKERTIKYGTIKR